MIPMITHLSTSSSDTDSTLTELSIQLEVLLLLFTTTTTTATTRVWTWWPWGVRSSFWLILAALWTSMSSLHWLDWDGSWSRIRTETGLVCQYQIFRYQLLVNIPLLAPTCYQLPQFEHLGWSLQSTPAPVGGLVGRSWSHQSPQCRQERRREGGRETGRETGREGRTLW